MDIQTHDNITTSKGINDFIMLVTVPHQSTLHHSQMNTGVLLGEIMLSPVLLWQVWSVLCCGAVV